MTVTHISPQQSQPDDLRVLVDLLLEEHEDMKRRLVAVEEQLAAKRRYSQRTLSTPAIKALSFMLVHKSLPLPKNVWIELGDGQFGDSVFATLLDRNLIDSPARHRFCINEKGIEYLQSIAQ